MPFDEPFRPPPRSNLRERLIVGQARRLERVQSTLEFALKDPARAGLSPVEADLYRQYSSMIKGESSRLGDVLTNVRRQMAAETLAEQELAEETPLQRSSKRRGYYRSGNELNAAIAGSLERERRQAAPLTREMFSRAKAIAAASGAFNLKQAYRKSGQRRGRPGVSFAPSFFDLRAVDLPGTLFDPCLDYTDRQRARRQVLFARKLAAVGYRTPKKRSPC